MGIIFGEEVYLSGFVGVIFELVFIVSYLYISLTFLFRYNVMGYIVVKLYLKISSNWGLAMRCNLLKRPQKPCNHNNIIDSLKNKRVG